MASNVQQDRGPPSNVAVAIGTAIVSALFGYYFGQARSIGLFGRTDTRTPAARLGRSSDESDSSSNAGAGEETGDESDSVQDLGELKTFSANNEECKLVLVVRMDLGMGKGMCQERCAAARFGLRFLIASSTACPPSAVLK